MKPDPLSCTTCYIANSADHRGSGTIILSCYNQTICCTFYWFIILHTDTSNCPRPVRVKTDIHSTIVDVVANRGWQLIEGESDSWDLYWCDVTNLMSAFDRTLGQSQIIPHFRNYYEISKKTLLARNIGRYKRQLLKEGQEQEAKLCDCIPTTFELPNDYTIFLDYYKKNPGLVYIVKPACGCKGSRIFLFKKIKELNDWRATRDWTGAQSVVHDPTNISPIDEREIDLTPEEWILQQYITNPYLIAGRKFDMRIFVLVISFVPMIVWINREGFARFCGKNFNLDNLKDNYSHLTNSSIQLAKDVKTPGFKWPIHRLRQYLIAKHGTEAFEQLLQSIGNITLTSLRSVQKTMAHNKHSLEMYGYDVIIDSDLRPWLLEINASPSLDPTDEEDYVTKCNLLSDLFNVIDYEGETTGNEIRIGGFDLFWCDGPVYRPCPNETELGPVIVGKRNLNINLGAYNNREEQLEELRDWRQIVEHKKLNKREKTANKNKEETKFKTFPKSNVRR